MNVSVVDRYGNRINPDTLFREKASPAAYDLVRRLRLQNYRKRFENDEVRPLLNSIKFDKFFTEKLFHVCLRKRNVLTSLVPSYFALSRMIPSYCFLNHSIASSRVTLCE